MSRRVCIRDVVAEAYKNLNGGNKIPDFRQLQGFFTNDPHKPNYMIVYRGSFNPPHRGHLSTLKAGLAAGKYLDSEIKAALVILRPSESVRRKYLRRGTELQVFSARQRCKLWTSENEFPRGKAWVWGQELESNCHSKRLFSYEAVRAAGLKFGVKIELIYLFGEDLVMKTPPEISFPQESEQSRIIVQRGESDNLLENSEGGATVWIYARSQIPMDQIGYRNDIGTVWKSQPGFFTNSHFLCYVENSQHSKNYSSTELNRLLETVKQEKEVTVRKGVIDYALSGNILLRYV